MSTMIDGEELQRLLCGVGVVARENGQDLIRRESVLGLVERRVFEARDRAVGTPDWPCQFPPPTRRFTDGSRDYKDGRNDGFTEGWNAAAEEAVNHLSSSVIQMSPLHGKYGNVLLPFVQRMAIELHANAGKGDREGWLKMSAEMAVLEIYYHVGKLQKAVFNEGGDQIAEFAADVANMAMMLLDICGGLEVPQ